MEWKDITIRGYQDLCKELDEQYPDELERSIGLLSCLTGKNISYYTDEIPVKELVKHLKKVDFIKKPIPKEKLKSFQRVGSKFYRFNLDLRSITAGEYIDLSTYVKDPKKINDNLHLILATLCYEINWFGFKKKSDHAERAKNIQENMSLPFALSLSSFFLSNYQRLIKGTNDFLESERKRMRKTMDKALKTALSNIGDGTLH